MHAPALYYICTCRVLNVAHTGTEGHRATVNHSCCGAEEARVSISHCLCGAQNAVCTVVVQNRSAHEDGTMSVQPGDMSKNERR